LIRSFNTTRFPDAGTGATFDAAASVGGFHVGLHFNARAFHPATNAAGHGGSVRAWAEALWTRLALMRRAAETRRELGTLNPRMLADIGVGRAEASQEAERWPWDLAPNRSPGRGTGVQR